jgi:hypothetical protein
MSSERRQDPRHRVHIAVDCQTREMFVSNYVTNISPTDREAIEECLAQLPKDAVLA